MSSFCMALHLPHITQNTGAIYSVYSIGKYNIFHRPDEAMLKACVLIIFSYIFLHAHVEKKFGKENML